MLLIKLDAEPLWIQAPGFTLFIGQRPTLLPGVWDYIKVDLYLQIIHHFFPHDLSFNLSPFVKWLKGPFWKADTHRPSPTTHFWQENSAIPPQPISWPIQQKEKKMLYFDV